MIPGFNRVEIYGAVIANAAPQLQRRPAPTSAAELLSWAGEPLATAEVALVMGRNDVLDELRGSARFTPAGADGYGTVR